MAYSTKNLLGVLTIVELFFACIIVAEQQNFSPASQTATLALPIFLSALLAWRVTRRLYTGNKAIAITLSVLIGAPAGLCGALIPVGWWVWSIGGVPGPGAEMSGVWWLVAGISLAAGLISGAVIAITLIIFFSKSDPEKHSHKTN